MWTCSWVSPHTRSTHQAYGSKDRKGNLEEKYAAGPHRNNTMCWEDVTQEMKNIFLMEHWPWCGPKTAVATLVWRSISLFFSRSSGRELFRERSRLLSYSICVGSGRGTTVGTMTNSYVKQLFCNMRQVLDEFRLYQDIFHTHNWIKLNFGWEVHFFMGQINRSPAIVNQENPRLWDNRFKYFKFCNIL